METSCFRVAFIACAHIPIDALVERTGDASTISAGISHGACVAILTGGVDGGVETS
tara:strand:- start:749 stop:916 length:168 start_codon:yes stop_codon:yes gene_type:complete